MQPHSHTTHAVARFSLGKIVITPGAKEALQVAEQSASEFLRRHMSGDWGDDDSQENELSLEQGFEVLSRYQTTKGERLWIITEADRSVTTILLPLEY